MQIQNATGSLASWDGGLTADAGLGAVTAAYQNGVPDEEILGHTPWP